MKKWNESLDDVKFESKEAVMAFIKKEEAGEKSWLEKVNHLLNLELEIPLAPVLAASVGFMLLIAVQIKPLEEPDYAYTITVIDAGGHHENY